MEKQYSLTQIIQDATQLHKKHPYRSLSNEHEEISRSGTISYFLSDHFPIFLIKKKEKVEKKSINFTGRCYTNYSLEALEHQLNLRDWHGLLQEPDPDIIWNSFLSILMEIADTLCPMKEFNITRQRPVYFTNEQVELIKERDTLLRLAIRKKDKDYWIRGSNLRKSIVGYIKEAKKTYIIDKLKIHKNNSKKYWKSKYWKALLVLK